MKVLGVQSLLQVRCEVAVLQGLLLLSQSLVAHAVLHSLHLAKGAAGTCWLPAVCHLALAQVVHSSQP